MLKSPSTKPGDVMECLIQNKQNVDMEEKCKAGIEHHQILTLKNYRFSFKFKVGQLFDDESTVLYDVMYFRRRPASKTSSITARMRATTRRTWFAASVKWFATTS